MKTKVGYKRVCGEIPAEMQKQIATYNAISTKPLNISRIIELAVTEAVRNMEKEVAEAQNGSDGIYCSYRFFHQILTLYKAGATPNQLKFAVAAEIESLGYSSGIISLFPITKVIVSEERGHIGFWCEEQEGVHVFKIQFVGGYEEDQEEGIAERISFNSSTIKPKYGRWDGYHRKIDIEKSKIIRAQEAALFEERDKDPEAFFKKLKEEREKENKVE